MDKEGFAKGLDLIEKGFEMLERAEVPDEHVGKIRFHFSELDNLYEKHYGINS